MVQLDEEDEELLSELITQIRSEVSEQNAEGFIAMVNEFRHGSEMLTLSSRQILSHLTLAFGLGRRYEAVIQNDMRADKEEPGL